MSQLRHSSVLIVDSDFDNLKDQDSQISTALPEIYYKFEKFPAGSLMGIFTQSDVLRLAANGDLTNQNLTIGEVMTSPVITLNLLEVIPASAGYVENFDDLTNLNKYKYKLIIDSAIKIFQLKQISHLPLIDVQGNIVWLLKTDFCLNYLADIPEERWDRENSDNSRATQTSLSPLSPSSPLSSQYIWDIDRTSGNQEQPNNFWLDAKKNIINELDIPTILNQELTLLLGIDRSGIIRITEGDRALKGWQAHELVGRNFLELHLDVPEAIAQLRHCLATGEDIEAMAELSSMFVSESYGDRFYQWRYLPWHNSQGELMGAIALATDITKRHKTEAELRSLFRAMTDMVFVLDRDGRYLNIAPTNSNLFYKPLRELLGKTLSELLPPETAALMLSRIQQSLNQQTTFQIEYSLPIQGRECWFDARISPFLEDSVIFVARDISDRIKSEHNLKQSQDFLQQIINAIPDPIFVKNENHEFVIVNDALCKLIGWSQSEIIGKSDPDFFPPEQVNVFWQVDRKVLETGCDYTIQEEVTDSAGNLHIISTKKTRVPDFKQNKFLVGTIREVTEQVKISEALKRSEERYRAFIGQTSEGIYCWEFNPPISLDQPEAAQIEQIFQRGYIVECNDAMAQMHGMTSGLEMIGTPVTQWRSPKEPETLEKTRQLIRAGYRLNKIETRWSNRPEGDRYFLLNLLGIIEQGCLQRLWITKLDISDRKKAQIALEQSEARYRGIIESQQDLIVRINPAGELTFVNDAYCALFGLPRSELLGQSYFALVHQEDRSHTLDVMKLLELPPYRVSFEQKAWTTQGCRWIVWENYAIHNEQGEIIEIQGVGRDITNRKEAESALRETENFLELFFCQSLEGFFFMMLDAPVQWDDTVDKEKMLDYVFAHQRVTKVNQAMLTQYKTKREEFIGLTPNDLFAHNLEYGRKIWRRLFDGGKLEIITDERLFDGTKVWIEGEYICLYDDQGRITGHFGVQRDITDRYRTEAALRESEERFRQIAENSQEIFWIASDDRQKLLYVNPAYETIFGQTCESLYTDPLGWIDRMIHPSDRYRILGAVMRQILDPQEISHEYRIILPDGSIRWLWERIFPIRNEQGEVYRQAGLVSDITQRKDMEETLRVTQERLGYLITRNPAVTYSLEPWGNCRMTFISDNVKALLGYEPEQFLENPGFWIDRIHPEDLPDISSPIESKWQPGQSISYEYRFLCDRGNYRWMRDENRLLLDEQGNPLEVVGYLADITERKQAEEEIRKAMKKERELNALKSRFITMTSHEFRTPLATILSSADLLEVYVHTGAIEKSSQHIQHIQAAAEHLTNMLNDILEIANSEARQKDFEPGSVDLAALCREIISEVKSSYPHRSNIAKRCGYNIAFICSRESEDRLSQALVDITLVRQILINLLSNALKYSGRDAQVELALSDDREISEENSAPIAESRSRIAIFHVKDTGVGISPEDRDRIFDAFYRGNNIGNIPGTGLGLAIVKHAVDLHGGKITFNSTVGVGTTFTVTLPLEVKSEK
jgi:PAS domain S-box-containing protein